MTGDYLDGWAVSDEDGVSIKTVSDTRRAAIVNWLVVRHGIVMSRLHNDADIERMWFELQGDALAIPVRISAHLH